MKRLFRILSLMLVICVFVSLMVTGCEQKKETKPQEEVPAVSGSEKKESEPEKAKETVPDTSKEVKLIGYLLGDAPAGMSDVMAKLNEKLKKDINVTMEINYIGWGDLQSKYPLVLAVGDDVDWIYTANWAFYAQEAVKGAFREITVDMLKTYMPRHYEAIKDTPALKEASVNGKVFMIPGPTPDRKVPVTLIREDLRKKYKVPEIKRFADIEPYLEAIRKNEPGMIPMNLDSSYDIGQALGRLVSESEEGMTWFDIMRSTTGGSGILYQFENPSGELHLITDEAALTVHKKAAAIVKSWYDKDYINKNAYANKVRSKESFEQGKSAIGFGNSQDTQGNIAKAESQGWEVGIVPGLSGKGGKYPGDPFINNAVAIAAKSKNAERAMMAMDLMMNEESYNYLVYFGVEGKNYVVKNGKIDLPEGVTPETNTYPPDAAGFWFTNKDQHLPLVQWSPTYAKLRSEVRNMVGPDIFAAFTPMTENVKTEVANCNQTMTQYFIPIQLGMIKDVDEAFKILDEKLKAAGVEKLFVEMKKQAKEFLSAQ